MECEERRRERVWDASQRWQAIQATIRWADAQRTVRRNTPGACLHRQERLLAGLRRRRSSNRV